MICINCLWSFKSKLESCHYPFNILELAISQKLSNYFPWNVLKTINVFFKLWISIYSKFSYCSLADFLTNIKERMQLIRNCWSFLTKRLATSWNRTKFIFFPALALIFVWVILICFIFYQAWYFVRNNWYQVLSRAHITSLHKYSILG